jgi:hypothetical protein
MDCSASGAERKRWQTSEGAVLLLRELAAARPERAAPFLEAAVGLLTVHETAEYGKLHNTIWQQVRHLMLSHVCLLCSALLCSISVLFRSVPFCPVLCLLYVCSMSALCLLYVCSMSALCILRHPMIVTVCNVSNVPSRLVSSADATHSARLGAGPRVASGGGPAQAQQVSPSQPSVAQRRGAVLCCAVLYCTVLCCAVLCCAVLCCVLCLPLRCFYALCCAVSLCLDLV